MLTLSCWYVDVSVVLELVDELKLWESRKLWNDDVLLVVSIYIRGTLTSKGSPRSCSLYVGYQGNIEHRRWSNISSNIDVLRVIEDDIGSSSLFSISGVHKSITSTVFVLGVCCIGYMINKAKIVHTLRKIEVYIRKMPTMCIVCGRCNSIINVLSSSFSSIGSIFNIQSQFNCHWLKVMLQLIYERNNQSVFVRFYSELFLSILA